MEKLYVESVSRSYHTGTIYRLSNGDTIWPDVESDLISYDEDQHIAVYKNSSGKRNYSINFLTREVKAIE